MIIKIQRLLGLAPIPRAKIISILEIYNYFRKKPHIYRIVPKPMILRSNNVGIGA